MVCTVCTKYRLYINTVVYNLYGMYSMYICNLYSMYNVCVYNMFRDVTSCNGGDHGIEDIVPVYT